VLFKIPEAVIHIKCIAYVYDEDDGEYVINDFNECYLKRKRCCVHVNLMLLFFMLAVLPGTENACELDDDDSINS